MCIMTHETIVTLKDLKIVVMTCLKCKTEISFDLTYERPLDIHRTTATPDKCPTCDALFDQRAQENIDALRVAYKAILTQKSFTLTFRTKPDVP